MRTLLKTTPLGTTLSLGLLLAGGPIGCDVDQTKQGELPDVDVDVDADPGDLPEYDVEWADVDVATTEETVTVPKLRVVMEEETVTVPVVDVDMPDDVDDEARVRRTIRVAVQVPGDDYEVEIKRVYYVNGDLLVVSELDGSGTGAKQIVSDNIIVNAPEVEVRHVIIGDRPAGAYNEQYRYVDRMGDLDAELTQANLLYED